MWTKFFSNGVLEKGIGYGKGLFEMADPLVGNQILKLQKNSLLARVDGRGLDVLYQQNGIMPRISESQLQTIRHSNVERYQKYNEQPFAWGACNSIQDLLTFITQNKSHTEKSWIHKFYGKSTPLLMLKYATGIEAEGLDQEKEEIIVQHVPFSQFIASTCPKYRERFLNGGMVPNAMYEYNHDLPKSMCIANLLTEQGVLTWLLINKAERAFTDVCKAIYAEMTQEMLAERFRNPQLVDAISNALKLDHTLKM